MASVGAGSSPLRPLDSLPPLLPAEPVRCPTVDESEVVQGAPGLSLGVVASAAAGGGEGGVGADGLSADAGEGDDSAEGGGAVSGGGGGEDSAQGGAAESR